MKRIVCLFALLALAHTPVHAVGFYFAPDAPVTLGGLAYMPWQIVQANAGAYALVASLPAAIKIGALQRMNSGDWLLSVTAPATLGGTTFEPSDVVRFDGIDTYTLFFGGAANGVPPGSAIDTLFLDGGDSGNLILGFDVPTTIAGNTYEPADLVRYDGTGFTLFFDASAATPPIPLSRNVTGASVQGANLLLTFDVPTSLGSTTFLPGDLVAWDGASFSLYYRDPSWPAGARLAAMGNASPCLAMAEVCDGVDNDCDNLVDEDEDGDGVGVCGDCDDANPTVVAVPSAIANLNVMENSGGYRLTWDNQSATAGSGTRYDVFSGLASSLRPLGDFSTGSCFAEDDSSPFLDVTGPPPPVGQAYYFMIRAQNECPNGTGSYGTSTRNTTAAQSPSACH
jgi:hypothetical protein